MPVGANTVNHLGVEFGHEFFDRSMEGSEEGRAIQEAMEGLGLYAQPERTHVFSVFSQVSNKAIAVCVTPFSGEDRSLEGGLSVSEGGHAQGVVVELKEARLVAFTHFALEGGSLRAERFEAEQLRKLNARGLSREAGMVKSAQPLVELNLRQVVSMSSLTFSNLLTDDFAQSVYSKEEVRDLRANGPIVSDISRFILLRTSGSSCCSCSTSCWGSCSSSCSSVG
jgi:hypothetical protein